MHRVNPVKPFGDPRRGLTPCWGRCDEIEVLAGSKYRSLQGAQAASKPRNPTTTGERLVGRAGPGAPPAVWETALDQKEEGPRKVTILIAGPAAWT